MASLSPRCMEYLRNMASSVRNVLHNPDIDKAEATAAIAKTVIDQMKYPTLRESMGTLVRNNFLSATSTFVKNFVGNAARMLEAPLTRFASGAATLNARRMAEGIDILSGYTKAFIEVFPRMIGGFKNRQVQFDGRTSKEFDFYLRFPGQDPNKVLDTVNKPLNAIVTFPQSFQRGVDEGFSTFFERAQYQVIMNRLKRATPESVLNQYGISRENLIARIEKAVESKNPSKDSLFSAVAKADPQAAELIKEFSLYGTFRSQLGTSFIDTAASKYFTLANKHPELSALITPFIITPLNIAKFGSGFVPGLGLLRMRQGFIDIKRLKTKRGILEGKYNKAAGNEVKRASLRKEINAVDGQIRFKQDLNNDFIGQQLLGLGFVGFAYSMVKGMQLTGDYPSDLAQRTRMIEAGIPPNSIKIGNRWVSYSGIEPLHTVLAVVSNGFKEIEQASIKGDTTLLDKAESIGNVVKAGFLDKTFTAQLADLMNAMTSEDGAKTERILVGMSNGLTPNMLNMLAKIEDPIKRQVKDPELATWIMNNMKSRLPYVRRELQPAYGLTGQEQPLGSTAEIATGFKFEELNRTQLQMLYDNPELKIQPPSSKLYGIELGAKEYSRMSKMMGDTTNIALNNMASSEGFMALPNSLQALAIKKIVGDIRSNIRMAFLAPLLQQDPEAYRKFMINEFQKKGLNPFTNPDIVID